MSGSASFQRVTKAQNWSSSLRQPDFAHQLSKPWVGAYGVESEVSLQPRQEPIALLIGGVEPTESAIFVSQVGIQCGNLVGGLLSAWVLLSRSPVGQLHFGRSRSQVADS
jgi:hypothetical protein